MRESNTPKGRLESLSALKGGRVLVIKNRIFLLYYELRYNGKLLIKIVRLLANYLLAGNFIVI